MGHGNANYDATVLTVDPESIDAHAENLKNHADEMVQALKTINDTIGALALGWAGATSQEAQEVTARWDSVMQRLFGTSDKPEAGVLNVMLMGLKVAAVGFSQTEVQLQQAFTDFHNSLGSAGGSTPTSAPPSVTDSTHTAVTETFGG